MPEKSASSQVKPNTPGGRGQAPMESGQAGPATTSIQAVEQSHQDHPGPQVDPIRPAPTTKPGDAPADLPRDVSPSSPAAAKYRDDAAEAAALADPASPSHCTVCGVELIARTELATGRFDPQTGEQASDGQRETGGGPGMVAILQCPTGIHETYRKVGGSWEREDTVKKGWGPDTEAREQH